jgi:hypothetical protein
MLLSFACIPPLSGQAAESNQRKVQPIRCGCFLSSKSLFSNWRLEKSLFYNAGEVISILFSSFPLALYSPLLELKFLVVGAANKAPLFISFEGVKLPNSLHFGIGRGWGYINIVMQFSGNFLKFVERCSCRSVNAVGIQLIKLLFKGTVSKE